MALTDVACRAAKAESKPRKLSDGGGLFLLVQPNGSKYWRWSYRFGGKQKTLALGVFPAVRLAQARAMRERAREVLAGGLDPSANKAALEAPATEGPGVTFRTVADEWLKAQEAAWTPAHALRVISRFKGDVYPAFGDEPIRELSAQKILKMLRTIEDRGAVDVAKRVRQSVGAVMRYAIATGRADRDPAADLTGALKPSPRVKHMAAIKQNELGEFMAKLRAYDGEPQTRLGLELIMRTMTRTNELRFGTWDEISGDVWRIPGDRMKMARDHMIPLPPQAQAILKELKQHAGGSPWIVPGLRGKPQSQNTYIFALYRMGYRSRVTVHGMRSLASTVLNESGLWSGDAIERQLAHVPGNGVRASYNHAEYWPERVRMVAWFNDFLDKALKVDDPYNLDELLR
ncbi:integrase arm-type DNA-binding domain-containing protein [Paracoccus nototheniae]|uniref:Tyrosine-type recombinase/integrase n=1 Tax=Paracoccus nototheniae TaxID=2489002 RepID=A0ABW4DWJ6_9RHOB|nr:integrase arm-type DNA-binding domain-containing protein [Paracoccus nototheniae]